ncbi:NYN domain-containing protein [Lentinula aciculospora]|uniref:NYN domain-containing protein n=1 Tax=Lentinula aciculospora TaxID=153920 RepID=A0A9W9AQC2_9AGAR|nr:NYN domain-containing protein [Lentinula aciculospora]
MALSMRTGSSAGHNGQVAIFWDYENCSPPPNISGYELVSRIRDLAHEHGSVHLFKAYTYHSEKTSARSLALRSELQSSGVSLTEFSRNDFKDVIDRMIIADVLTFAMDNPYPSTTTIMLISNEREFAYALSILRLRMYRVIVVAPMLPRPHISLKSQASFFFNWFAIANGQQNEEKDTTYPLMESSTSSGSYRSPNSTSSCPPILAKSREYCGENWPSPKFSWKILTAVEAPRTYSKSFDSGLQIETKNTFASTPIPENQNPPFTTEATSIATKGLLRFPVLLEEDSPDIGSVPLSESFPLIPTDVDSQKTIFSESEDQSSSGLLPTHSIKFTNFHAVGFAIPKSLNRKRGSTASRVFLGRLTPEVPEGFQRLVHLLEDY